MQIRACPPKQSPLHDDEGKSEASSSGESSRISAEERVTTGGSHAASHKNTHPDSHVGPDAAHLVGFHKRSQASGRSVQAAEYALCREGPAGSPLELQDAVSQFQAIDPPLIPAWLAD